MYHNSQTRISLVVVPTLRCSQLYTSTATPENSDISAGAEIRAMEGKVPVLRMFDLDDLPTHSFTSLDIQTPVVNHRLPSLDDGFRHH